MFRTWKSAVNAMTISDSMTSSHRWSRILCLLIASTIASAIASRTIEAQDFSIDWIAPDEIDANASNVNRFTARSTVTSSDVATELGAQAWSLAVVVDGGDLIAATTEGTAGAEDGPSALRSGGFELTELTTGEGNEGAVSAVVLSFSQGQTLPIDGTAEVLEIEVEAPSPELGCSEVTLRYAESLVGTGEPITTRIIYQGIGERPTQSEAVVRICQRPMIRVTPSTISFGEVFAGSTESRQIEIQNSGTDTLNVDDVQLPPLLNDAAFSLVPLSLPTTVAPGESLIAEIQYSPTSLGIHEGLVAISSNAVNTPEVQVQVAGTGLPVPVPELTVTPRSLDMGEVIIGRSATHEIVLENTGTAALEISAADLAPNGSALYELEEAIDQTVLAPGSTLSAMVRFSPIDESVEQTALLIDSNDPDEPFISVAIQASGIIEPLPSIVVEPDMDLDFGGVVIGRTFSQSITVRNDGDAPLDIHSIGLDELEPGFVVDSVNSARLFPGVGNVTIEVTYQPAAEGIHTAVLVIESDDPNRPRIEIGLEGQSSERPITPFRRGDPNGDTSVDISDGIMIFGHLFLGRQPPTCLDAGDANDDGRLDIGDGIYLLNFLFLDGPDTPAPGTTHCGTDETPDSLIACSQALCS